jgi:hypothetical protein
MTTQENSNPPQTTPQRRKDTLGPSLGIILVAVIVFFALNSSPNDRYDSKDTTFSNTAILSGIDRRIVSTEFQSGDASAFMGGIKLDFRDATMKGNEATLDVSAIMGGVDIRIPRDWTVINRVTPILGGIENHTHSTTGADKRLIIEGTVLMGGLEIQN